MSSAARTADGQLPGFVTSRTYNDTRGEPHGGLLSMGVTYDSFANWVSPHLAALRSYATRAVVRDDVDEVLQETLLRAWKHKSSFDPSRGTERVWLLAILANQCRRHRRTTMRWWPAIADQEPIYRQALPDLDLERAIRKLSKRQREAITLYYFVRLTMSEVAAVLGCSEGTAKSTMSDARRSLKRMLEEK